MDVREVSEDNALRFYLSAAADDQWILLNPSGRRPLGRYKHCALIIEEKLYVVGGSRNGRHLSDIQVFDFTSMQWSTFCLYGYSNNSFPDSDNSKNAFPAISGHSLVKWENKLLIVGGHSKEVSDTVTVWSIEMETNKFHLVDTHGKAPTGRGGQSVTLVGTKLLVFGGEDTRRGLLNDLHALDLSTMSWDSVQTMNMSPAPRFDHTAVAHGDRYLLIFGGSSHSTCFNDLHVLDLHTMEWSQPETQGIPVTPRGGHAGAIIDDQWYIVGGGDNRSGATETIVLHMSKLVWSLSTIVSKHDPLASEGLSVCSTKVGGEKLLVAFGGYNGKYNNELFVLKPKTRDSIPPRLFKSPAAAAAAASVTAAYSLRTAADNKGLANEEDASIKLIQGNVAESIMNKSASGREFSEFKLDEATNGNSRLKERLDELNISYGLLLTELQSVQGQLTAEKSRCIKLEIEIAGIRKRLDSFSSLEHELEVLRSHKLQIHQDMTNTQGQSSGGIWRWMAGTDDRSFQ